MSRSVTLTFDPPPSINKMFGQSPGHKRFPLAATAVWHTAALWQLKAAKIEPFEVPFRVEIKYPDEGRYDLNNRDKAVLDVLKKSGVIPNDSRKWFREMTLSWAPIDRTTVTITEIEE